MRLSQNLVERISGIRAGNLPVRRSHAVSETCETHISKCFYGEVSINKKNLRVHLIIMKRIILTVITRLIKSIIVVTGWLLINAENICEKVCWILKRSFKGVLAKRCFENMKQIYRRTPMRKCDFNKVWFQVWFQNTFHKNISEGMLLWIPKFVKNPYFFNCYLASIWPTLGHSQGDSLTNPILITAF